mgnify:CR=1 FL=1
MRRLALAIVAVAACDNHHEARVGPALLPQANLTAPLPPGTTPVAIMPGAAPPAGPAALAIDVNVPWAQVAAAVRAAPAPTLVVGRYRHLRAFTLEDELDAGPAVKITATGLTPGVLYAFRVRGIGSAGPGAWSDEATERAP